MFPFDITFKKKLSPEFDSISDEKIMALFFNDFAYSRCKIIETEKNKIEFDRKSRNEDILIPNEKKGFSFFKVYNAEERNWNGISKASFEIVNTHILGKRTAIYKCSINKINVILMAFFYLIVVLFSKFNPIAIVVIILFFIIQFGVFVIMEYSTFSLNFRRFKYEAKKILKNHNHLKKSAFRHFQNRRYGKK